MRDEGEIPSSFLRVGNDLTGKRIGVYQITSLVGAGGMGEVYRARDTKLGREVAIKVLPEAFTNDADRLARFQREARVLAALSHPHIGAIYGFDDSSGTPALVLELVEGETLADRLRRGPVALGEALHMARQIAAALDTAHECGVVHRDLKPANIKVTPDGTVKVLDFGLAKLAPPKGRPHETSDESSDPSMRTRDGALLGTAPYMSPEQVRGQPVDKRADIWAFGCVLFEMLTGRVAFHGDTVSDTIAGILGRDPDWSAFPASVPANIHRLAKRCLEKDPRRRLRDVGDAQIELEEAARPPDLAHEKRSPRSAVMVAGIVAAVLAASIGYATWPWRAGSEPVDGSMAVVPLTTYPGIERNASFSPDGGQIAFVWNGQRKNSFDLYVKVVGSSAPPLQLTSGVAADLAPAWSPNGREIAFVRGSTIFSISPLGRSERKIVDFAVSSRLSWAPDGRSIVATERGGTDVPGGVFLIPVEGGEIRRLTSVTPPQNHQSPVLSRDGRRLAFASCSTASFWYCEVHVMELAPDGTATSSRRVSPDGLYFRGLTWTADSQAVIYSASALSAPYRLWRAPVEGSQDPQPLPGIMGSPLFPDISQKGDRLVFSQEERETDSWLFESGRAPIRLISSTVPDRQAILSSDGTRIAFTSERTGKIEIWRADADGSNPVQLTSTPGEPGSPRWSADGRWIAYDYLVAGRRGIWVVEAAGGQSRQIVDHPSFNRVPSWSRDGRFLYFSSNRTGSDEIFRVAVSGGEAVQVTDRGGYVALESADGSTLFYIKFAGGPSHLFSRALAGGAERQVMSDLVFFRGFDLLGHGVYYITRDANDEFSVKVFEFATAKTRVITPLHGEPNLGLSVSPDGQRIVYTLFEEGEADLMLVENFR